MTSRHPARCRAQEPTRVTRADKPPGRHSRPRRWREAVAELLALQAEYTAWLEANWYQTGINPTYRDIAARYRTAILPTRMRRLRDKAKVEVGVLAGER